MNDLTTEAAERLSNIFEQLAPAVQQEQNKDLKHILTYFLSLVPTQIALLRGESSDELTALALAILGKDAK